MICGRQVSLVSVMLEDRASLSAPKTETLGLPLYCLFTNHRTRVVESLIIKLACPNAKHYRTASE